MSLALRKIVTRLRVPGEKCSALARRYNAVVIRCNGRRLPNARGRSRCAVTRGALLSSPLRPAPPIVAPCSRITPSVAGARTTGGSLVKNQHPRSTRVSPVKVSGLGRVKKIAIGGSDDAGYTCAILEDESVSCWGHNASMQLGDETNVSRASPAPVPELDHVVDLALGFWQSCALLEGGTVKCWGMNAYGQAVPESMAGALGKPTSIADLSGVVSLAAGVYHTCARRGDGSVRCWGVSKNYQISWPNPPGYHFPVTAIEGAGPAQALAAAYYHSCTIRSSDGHVLCWGADNCAELGQGDVCGDGCLVNSLIPCGTSVPSKVGLPAAALLISLGASHGCALTDDLPGADHGVFCWGRNDFHQAGNSTGTPPGGGLPVVSTPSLVLTKAKKIAVGAYHSCALLENSQVYCWGRNDFGQLGREPISQIGLPAAVEWEP